jgi:hypothetical protein
MTGDDADRDAALRSYLLGSLSPARQEELEEQFLADGELHAELQATADDLIQAYLAGDLSPTDRERFESHFLASPRRRERTVFMRSLLSAVERVGARQPRSLPASNPRRLLSPFLPWAAALVVGLAIGTWSLGERRRHQSDLAEAQRQAAVLQERLADAQRRVSQLPQDTAVSDVASWPLRAGLTRSETVSNVFRMPGEPWVRVTFAFADEGPRDYAASLRTAGGRVQADLAVARAKGKPGTLEAMVPAALLRPGSYVIVLRRYDVHGRAEDVEEFPLQVRP